MLLKYKAIFSLPEPTHQVPEAPQSLPDQTATEASYAREAASPISALELLKVIIEALQVARFSGPYQH